MLLAIGLFPVFFLAIGDAFRPEVMRDSDDAENLDYVQESFLVCGYHLDDLNWQYVIEVKWSMWYVRLRLCKY